MQVGVDVPDVKGRTEILKVHARNKKLSEEVDLNEIAQRTPGFSGADLANLLNEVRSSAGLPAAWHGSSAAAAALLSPAAPVAALATRVQPSQCRLGQGGIGPRNQRTGSGGYSAASMPPGTQSPGLALAAQQQLISGTLCAGGHPDGQAQQGCDHAEGGGRFSGPHRGRHGGHPHGGLQVQEPGGLPRGRSSGTAQS